MAASLKASEGHFGSTSPIDTDGFGEAEVFSVGIKVQDSEANISSECDTTDGDSKCSFCDQVGISNLQNELQGVGYPRGKTVTKNKKNLAFIG